MLKQNIPGFYGLGTAFKKLDMVGRLEDLKKLYKKSLYFKTLIDNSEMASVKSNFDLTKYLKNDTEYSDIWQNLYEEYLLTLEYLNLVSGKVLMQDYPIEKYSITLREKIILPLVTIQQYALAKLREDSSTEVSKALYEKLIVRSAFGIINASRNSA
jgi:phosphoenolpyruvate carboxylase